MNSRKFQKLNPKNSSKFSAFQADKILNFIINPLRQGKITNSIILKDPI
jgi:hypothetical protein